MKSASKMLPGETFIKKGKWPYGKGRAESVRSETTQYRLLTAPSNTRTEELQGEEMIASLMSTASQSTRWFVKNATTQKAVAIFSLLFLAALILSPNSSRAQAGAAISGQWVLPGGTPAANARIYVCPYTASGIPCAPQAAIYADPGLTTPVTQPYATNQYGNATVFAAAGTYLVQVMINQTITYSYAWTVNTYGIGYVSASGAPSIVCNKNNVGQVYTNNLNGDLYNCYGTGSSYTWNLKASSASGCSGGNTIANGCTGATTSQGALTNLGAEPRTQLYTSDPPSNA